MNSDRARLRWGHPLNEQWRCETEMRTSPTWPWPCDTKMRTSPKWTVTVRDWDEDIPYVTVTVRNWDEDIPLMNGDRARLRWGHPLWERWPCETATTTSPTWPCWTSLRPCADVRQLSVVVEVRLQVLGDAQLLLALLRLAEQQVPQLHHLLVLAADVLVRVWVELQQLLGDARDAVHLAADRRQVLLRTDTARTSGHGDMMATPLLIQTAPRPAVGTWWGHLLIRTDPQRTTQYRDNGWLNRLSVPPESRYAIILTYPNTRWDRAWCPNGEGLSFESSKAEEGKKLK